MTSRHGVKENITGIVNLGCNPYPLATFAVLYETTSVVSQTHFVGASTARLRFPPVRRLTDERALALHHAARLGYLVLTQRHDPAQHGASDGLIEDCLNTAESDDQSVLDDGATPLGHAGPVEVRSVLLNLAA